MVNSLQYEILDLVTEDVYSAQELLACVGTASSWRNDDHARRHHVLSTLAVMQQEKLIDVRDEAGREVHLAENDDELRELTTSRGERILLSASALGKETYDRCWHGDPS